MSNSMCVRSRSEELCKAGPQKAALVDPRTSNPPLLAGKIIRPAHGRFSFASLSHSLALRSSLTLAGP